MSKTLFLKDSVLFISIDGKEYEVSNPKVFEDMYIPLGVTYNEFFLFHNGGYGCEWPGGVELIEMCGARDNKYDAEGCSACHGLCPEVNKLARLLPKEKKEPTPLQDLQTVMSHTESDYKQFEELTGIPEERVKVYEQHYKGESSEPQEKGLPAHSKEFVEDLQRHITKLASDNKLLREEIERLQAEVLKEKFPPN